MRKFEYISIGIPIYNAESYLADAIKSVLAQTYPYWELILVDDGSTDNSLEIAQEFAAKDNRIRIISDGLNKKLPARLNQIIKEAKYDYIARMDADDLMDPRRLELQLEVLKSNNIDLVTTGLYSIGENNEIQGKRILKNYQMQPEQILNGLTNLLHASLLAKKEWCLRNLYKEDNVLAEDYELWLTASIKNDLKYIVIEKPLYFYREVENVKKVKMIKGYNTQISVINRYFKGIISESEKNKIIFKFNLKKIVVTFLDFLNLMSILEKKRVNPVSKSEALEYEKVLKSILS
ncbi:glycosyltransferase family 2 protein [Acinetobacter indicus]|uniref:glycosyltransferase family 2 protein n=1 Tax=Acinetobacter indicus TaxID=756892 RepID=UPI0014440DB6|nr:glycosyltransferase family 2 protein [Acinetobacter indicus]